MNFLSLKKNYEVEKLKYMWKVNIKEAQLVQALYFEFDWHTSLRSKFSVFVLKKDSFINSFSHTIIFCL